MRIAITGADGQLGCELQRVLGRHDLIPFLWPAFDLLRDEAEGQVRAAKPEVIVHAAAFTDVDGAEREPGQAMAVNVEGTGRVARAAAAVGARLIVLSTDYVFDGNKHSPYLEDDEPHPLNVYGRSKLEAERQAMTVCPDALIVRTAWLYGPQGKNFVKTIMRLAGEQPALRVVSDQRGSPTHAGDLADALLHMLTLDLRGVVHASGSGDCSWHEFAQAIVGMMEKAIPVHPISTGEALRPAARPAYSVLANRRLAERGITLPHWKEALGRFIASQKDVPGSKFEVRSKTGEELDLEPRTSNLER
jgi:dTDP-4-dehydrorhamnose reductase